jgi:hypothetical protein
MFFTSVAIHRWMSFSVRSLWSWERQGGCSVRSGFAAVYFLERCDEGVLRLQRWATPGGYFRRGVAHSAFVERCSSSQLVSHAACLVERGQSRHRTRSAGPGQSVQPFQPVEQGDPRSLFAKWHGCQLRIHSVQTFAIGQPVGGPCVPLQRD